MRLVLALGLVLATAAGAQISLPRTAPAPRATFTAITVLPMATRAAGTVSFGPATIPTGVQGAMVTLDVSEATDPLPKITAIVEGSRDGGATWQSVGSFTRETRVKGTRPNGSAVTTLGAGFGGGTFWNDTVNAQRRLRGVATLTTSMRFALVVQPQ